MSNILDYLYPAYVTGVTSRRAWPPQPPPYEWKQPKLQIKYRKEFGLADKLELRYVPPEGDILLAEFDISDMKVGEERILEIECSELLSNITISAAADRYTASTIDLELYPNRIYVADLSEEVEACLYSGDLEPYCTRTRLLILAAKIQSFPVTIQFDKEVTVTDAYVSVPQLDTLALVEKYNGWIGNIATSPLMVAARIILEYGLIVPLPLARFRL